MNNQLRIFKIKLLNWEYWPMGIVYFPLSVYYLFLSLKAKSFFFFNATNPGLENGGMFFESKAKIYDSLPVDVTPTTLLCQKTESIEDVAKKITYAGLKYPIIAKPDRGERGWKVEKITSITDLNSYIKRAPSTFLIQPYIDLSEEYSVFYIRHPKSKTGVITSLTFKNYLSVVGDGISTIDQLIDRHDRSFLKKEQLLQLLGDSTVRVLAAGEKVTLVPFGNHVRGAEFINFNHKISEKLRVSFEEVSKKLEGFYYGRFDVKANSFEDLEAGSFQIIELNGTGAEPSHIYNPGYNFFKAQKDIFSHYKQMCAIAIQNRTQGATFMTLATYRDLKKQEKLYKQC